MPDIAFYIATTVCPLTKFRHVRILMRHHCPAGRPYGRHPFTFDLNTYFETDH
jgi:hypothetical protein